MFRKMRRAERELPEGQAKEILENGSYGVLALAGMVVILMPCRSTMSMTAREYIFTAPPRVIKSTP